MEAKPRLTTRQDPSRHKGRLLQARVRPGRHDAANGSGAMTSTERPYQHTTPQQVRGSARHQDTRTRQPRHDQPRKMPRSETPQEGTTCWLWSAATPQDGPRPASRIRRATAPHASECHAPKAPSSASPQDGRERDPTAKAARNSDRRCQRIKSQSGSGPPKVRPPAANQTRNNESGCRHPIART